MRKKFLATQLLPRLFLLLLVGGLAFGSTSCKSKKKAAQEAAAQEYADKVEKAIAELNALLNDDGTMPITEKERRLNDIKAQNLNDPTVNDLIRQVEEKLAAEKEAQRLEDEQAARKKQEAENESQYNYMDEYFNQIAHATSPAEANQKIAQTLKMFASSDVPVLIIISKAGAEPDYDKPTTIDNYLNYLKDTKQNPNRIENVKLDDYGQITLLELIKK